MSTSGVMELVQLVNDVRQEIEDKLTRSGDRQAAQHQTLVREVGKIARSVEQVVERVDDVDRRVEQAERRRERRLQAVLRARDEVCQAVQSKWVTLLVGTGAGAIVVWLSEFVGS